MNLERELKEFETWVRLEQIKETAALTRMLLNSLLQAQKGKL